MSQPSRKRQHQESPPVKQEQQQEEENTHSFVAGINANQCSSSSNREDSNNTTGTAAGGNGGDDIHELKLKMAMLEAKNQILEGKLEDEKLWARLHAKSEEGILANLKQENRALWTRLNEVEENAQTHSNKIMDAFGQMFTAWEAKHQQEIAGLWAKMEFAMRSQQPATPNCQTPDSDCLVVNMVESRGTSNNSNEIHNIAPNLVPCHSANLPDCVVNMPQSHSHGNLNTLDDLEIRRRQQEIMAAIAALVPPPPMSVTPNPVPRHSAQQQMANKRRLCNLEENYWNVKSSRATMKVSPADGLTAHNSSPEDWGNVYAKKGFRISNFRLDQFAAGQMLYYYEITNKSTSVSEESQFYIGLILSDAMLAKDSWIGWTPNTYAMPEKCDYCLLSGTHHQFEEPNGAIVPKWNGHGDIVGCGLVLSVDHKLTIFFTNNGILMGKQMPIMPLGSNVLTPTVCLNRNVTLEANFGAKPFKYNIDECPGLVMQW